MDEQDEISNYVLNMRNNDVFIPSDMSNFQQSNTPVNSNKVYSAYLIVDTNFLLSNLSLLDDLEKLLHGKYAGVYQIIIPKQVVHELDGLKDSGKSVGISSHHSISRLARKAIDWCYSHFHELEPTVTGQRLHERIDRDASKDNSILDCCLYFQNVENGGGNMVVLLSNDKNLCVKALVNNILTISFRPEMTANLIASNILSELQQHRAFQLEQNVNNYSNNYQQEFNNYNNIQEQNNYNQNNYNNNNGFNNVQNNHYDNSFQMEDNENAMDLEMDLNNENKTTQAQQQTPRSNDVKSVSLEINHQVTKLVLEAINFAVVSIYGDDVGLIDYDENRMHNLDDAAKCIVRLGFSTFADFFDRRGFNPMKILENRKQRDDLVFLSNNIHDLKDFVTFWSDFLDGIYKKRDLKQQNALKQICKWWDTRINEIE